MSAPRSILTIAFLLCALSGYAAVGAGAFATIAPSPAPSAGSGLPDGRVYEEASPANKHGYQAGASGRSEGQPQEVFLEFSVASPDGNAVAYGSVGPAAEVNASGLNKDFVAEHTSHGWTSRSSVARGLGQNEEFSLLAQTPIWTDYSPDLSHMAYIVRGAEIPGAPAHGYANIYLLGPNPMEAPTWLFQSASGPSLEEPREDPELVGMSPDASILYVAYDGHVLPQDASRSGWGLYEYRDGVLGEAGVLPDGSVPPMGALPMATAVATEKNKTGENNPASLDNQLSEDGKRVFFVSSGELYVHKTEADGSEHSVLVSASELPGHLGEAAPDGVVLFANPAKNAERAINSRESSPTYGYAAPDGSHVFFQSEDQLTSSAPAGSSLKVYDFDVDAGSLEYLPGVSLGGIVTAAKDGSSFAFENGAGSPELDIWSAGLGGGSVRRVAQLPGGGFVGPARMTAENSVLVFQASAEIPGFNNAGSEQIYRYDVDSNELGCVSCPPAGVAPSGNAYLSGVDQYVSRFVGSSTETQAVNDARGVSADGRRVFFSSPDPLTGRDTNGDFDTYEWEDGKVFLISSGTSSDYSLFLDNSESGSDVFFATSDELVRGDDDAGFDVYDARIPHPGDNPPPSAVPCSGDVCQGPPSVPQLLGAPPSATFSGAGNVVESPAAKAKSAAKKSTSKAVPRARKLASALRACHKRKAGPRRTTCEKQARQRYRPARTATKRDRKGKR